jgi:hypothetical protein
VRRLALRGVEADAVHQGVNRAAEHQRIGGVVHMVVVVDPRCVDACFVDEQSFAAMHGALLRGGPRPVAAALAAISPQPSAVRQGGRKRS